MSPKWATRATRLGHSGGRAGKLIAAGQVGEESSLSVPLASAAEANDDDDDNHRKWPARTESEKNWAREPLAAGVYQRPLRSTTVGFR